MAIDLTVGQNGVVKEQGGANNGAPYQQENVPNNPGSFADERSFDKNNRAGSMLGFGSSGLRLMGGVGGDYTNQVAALIEEAYDKAKVSNFIKLSVTPFDKNVIPNILCSIIVISSMQKDEVFYYTVILEATGNKPMTAAEVMAEVAIASKNPGQQPQIITPDDCNDRYLHDEVIKPKLAQMYGSKTFVQLDGIILSRDVHDLANAAYSVATSALDAIYIEKSLDDDGVKDISLEQAIRSSKGQLRFESIFSTGASKNSVDMPIRADWKVNLSMFNSNAQAKSVNAQNVKQVINSVTGFIDSLPEDIEVPAMNGFGTIKRTTLRPQIIITNLSPTEPTPCNTILSLLSGAVMANRNMWGAGLPVKEPKHQVGLLNCYTDIMGEAAKGEPISKLDLSSKSMTAMDVQNTIRAMYTLAPTISLDIPVFGPETFYESLFSVAANGSNSEAARAASNEIISAAHWLTSGKFPLEYDLNKIFVTKGVVLPMGEWASKSELRDIREIDLAFIAGHTTDTNLLNKYILSSVPYEISHVDPYLTRVDVISKIVPDAKITGKLIRVTFRPEFIDALQNAAAQAGLEASYEPAIRFADNNNIGVVSSIMANAGISNGSPFLREYGVAQNGYGYNTTYGNGGFGRF